MRYTAIKEKWEINPIPFSTDHYLYHNFYKTHDFQDIINKQLGSIVPDSHIKEDASEEFRDFIPYKEGKRIQKII
jgi:hypothetical protein